MRTRVHWTLVATVATATLGFTPPALSDDRPASEVRVVSSPPTGERTTLYISNRAPLQPSPLIKLPIQSIDPRGWLRKQIELQAAGFHGHLPEISRFLKRDGNAWLSPDGEGDAFWEEVPYWLKGYCNAAFVLDDPRMLAETRMWIEAAIGSQRDDGWFGPRTALTSIRGKPDLWGNMIMLFCLQDYYAYTGDERVIELMTRYFKFVQSIPDDGFLPGYWDTMRGGDLLYSVYWLYNRTGDISLLELSQKVHRHTARWDEDIINWHNVNISQAFGEPATFWLQAGEPRYLRAAYRNYDKVRDLYGQVPGGMFGADENARPGYTDPRQAIETCGMVEMMLSAETLVAITGDLTWANRCEDVVFNSLPAALTADLKALRYLTAPNMIQSDVKNKSPGLQNAGPMLHMNPWVHRCCQHNFGHGWPYFAQHLYFATPDHGLAVVFYADSTVTAKVGQGVEVRLEQSTHYPFAESISFQLHASAPTSFPLYVRVPGWCDAPIVRINGTALDVAGRPDHFIVLDRTWVDGDQIELTLPMYVSLRRWPANHDSVSVDRGPLTYSLQIGERYVRHGGTDEWPAWEIYPTSPWNYGLVLNDANPAASFQVHTRPWPDNEMPFTHEGTPIQLVGQGKRIPQWQRDKLGLVGLLQQSPVTSDQPTEMITLIPMGAARLRISQFPVIGSDANASVWQPPPKPRFQVVASHCYAGDDVDAVADGREPKSSDDHLIPRMTWWDHQGSTEWIEARFDQPRQVSSVEVYWFDDTGRGSCRVPKSWQVSYRDGDTFRPVVTDAVGGSQLDTYNRMQFQPVTTTALRIEVELQAGYSGGILEWTVGGPPPAKE